MNTHTSYELKEIHKREWAVLLDEPILCCTKNGWMELPFHIRTSAITAQARRQWCEAYCKGNYSIDFNILSFEKKSDLLHFRMIMDTLSPGMLVTDIIS